MFKENMLLNNFPKQWAYGCAYWNMRVIIQAFNIPWNNYVLKSFHLSFKWLNQKKFKQKKLGDSRKMMFNHHLHHWLFPTYFHFFHTSPHFSHIPFISFQRTLGGNECERESIRCLYFFFSWQLLTLIFEECRVSPIPLE